MFWFCLCYPFLLPLTEAYLCGLNTTITSNKEGVSAIFNSTDLMYDLVRVIEPLCNFSFLSPWSYLGTTDAVSKVQHTTQSIIHLASIKLTQNNLLSSYTSDQIECPI